MKTIITPILLLTLFALQSVNGLMAQNMSIEFDSDAPTLSPHLVLIETEDEDFSRLWFQDKDDPSVRWAFLARPGHPTSKDIAMAYNGVPKWRLDDSGVMTINDEYYFPNVTGPSSTCLVMSKTVPGQLEWTFPRVLASENGFARIQFHVGDGIRFTADDMTAMEVDMSEIKMFTGLNMQSNQILMGGESLGVNGSGDMVVTTKFRPTGNGLHDLGSLANRWNRVFAANGTIQTSDARLKKNIETVPYGLTTVMEMNPVVYNWKEENNQDKKHLGFLAQDLLTQTPEVVFQDETIDQYGVKYAELIPVLVKAIQEQQAMIEAQALEIRKLQE